MRTARFIDTKALGPVRIIMQYIHTSTAVRYTRIVRVLLVTVLHRMHAWHLGSRFVLSVQLCSTMVSNSNFGLRSV